MKVSIECYGGSARWCGAERIELDVGEDATARDALDRLAARYPDFAARRAAVAVARGEELIPPATPLRAGDQLALIPPVSGG